MNLVEFRDWSPKAWSELSADEWESRLLSVCGRFHPTPVDDFYKVTGDVVLQNASGLELARVSNNLSIIRRDEKDIRLDFGGNFFLVIQIEGACGVEQNGRQSEIGPGDCILLDSVYPVAPQLRRQVLGSSICSSTSPVVVVGKGHRLGGVSTSRCRRPNVRRASCACREDLADERRERESSSSASAAVSGDTSGFRSGRGPSPTSGQLQRRSIGGCSAAHRSAPHRGMPFPCVARETVGRFGENAAKRLQ